ncbi:DUF2188 domain-containing protein [Lysobacter firmicutimachus]|uniref:DUF2188 domain-containing protein n=1 Tax=Lysobacter firmicutimachus TaxID=1792846 RepID=A0AAU8MXS8_9GAMM
MRYFDVIEDTLGRWTVRTDPDGSSEGRYPSRADAIAAACAAAKTHHQTSGASTAVRLIHPPDDEQILVRYLSPGELDALCWFGDDSRGRHAP